MRSMQTKSRQLVQAQALLSHIMQPYEAPCRLAWRDWRTAWCSGAALWQVQRDISAIWRHISARVGDAPRPQARTPGASDHLIMHWFRRSEVTNHHKMAC